VSWYQKKHSPKIRKQIKRIRNKWGSERTRGKGGAKGVHKPHMGPAYQKAWPNDATALKDTSIRHSKIKYNLHGSPS